MTNNHFLGLRSLIFTVNDIQAAKAWYAKVVGKSPYFDESAYVGFNIGGFELGLFAQSGDHGSGSASGYWGVNDVDTEYTRLLYLGATEHSPPTDVGGGIRLATVLDPFNNILGIIHNPEFQIE